jgi:hypothetical protein
MFWVKDTFCPYYNGRLLFKKHKQKKRVQLKQPTPVSSAFAVAESVMGVIWVMKKKRKLGKRIKVINYFLG